MNATTQDGINEAEWRNPENWGGGFLGLYFSKRDSRVWVPKRRPGLGWTLNFAHRRSALWLLGLIAGPPLVAGALKRLLRK